MFQVTFFWEAITLPGPGRFLGLLGRGFARSPRFETVFLDSVTQKGLAGNVGESRGDLAAAAGADFVHPDIFSSHHHTSTNSARAPRFTAKASLFATGSIDNFPGNSRLGPVIKKKTSMQRKYPDTAVGCGISTFRPNSPLNFSFLESMRFLGCSPPSE